ncbi:hypothetical protein BDZ89DRAFT_1065608 [Hymenopellis radicata]|nr:hypothetical protein BDZ89DRAFT_1065608 [Hymenopellis radicata]
MPGGQRQNTRSNTETQPQPPSPGYETIVYLQFLPLYTVLVETVEQTRTSQLEGLEQSSCVREVYCLSSSAKVHLHHGCKMKAVSIDVGIRVHGLSVTRPDNCSTLLHHHALTYMSRCLKVRGATGLLRDSDEELFPQLIFHQVAASNEDEEWGKVIKERR